MDVLSTLTDLGPVVIYVALAALVFAESAAWLGLLVPGDVALLTAGALTATGDVSIPAVVASALVGTLTGYAVVFELGSRLGPRFTARVERHARLSRDLPVARRLVAERGSAVIVGSRWVGALCALVPVVAGVSGMPRRRFHALQLVGAVLWVVPVALLGRVAGRSGAPLLWVSLAVAALVAISTWVSWRRVAGRPVPRAVVWGAIGVGLGVATAFGLVRLAGPDAVAAAFASVDPLQLVAVAVLEVGALAALTQLYRTTFAVNGGRLGWRDALTVTLGAFSLTQLLPGGGAAGGVWAVRRLRTHGADPVRATTTVLMVGLVSMGTLGLVISHATTVAASVSTAYTGYTLVSGAATAVVFGALALLRRLTEEGSARRRLVGWLERLRWRGRPVAREWADSLQRHEGLLHRPTALLGPMGWSALNWTFDVGVLALLLDAVGAEAPLVAVLVAFAVANLLNALPLTPGGIGLIEVGLAGTLVGLGADPAATSVAVVGYRATAYWLPTVLAAPIVVSGVRTRSGQEVAA